jgi:electron transport complex protein RnfB
VSQQDEVNILKLTELLEDALPQTQCTKCGYPDCHGYALAMAEGRADHNRCPPGGAEGIQRLGNILGRELIALNEECGIERPRPVARIDPKQCIGCTLCIKACPVDAIVGAAKQLHVIIEDRCTGCDLCIPPCPVDCIDMVNVTGELTGWQAWSSEQAQTAREQYHSREKRLIREKADNDKKLADKAAGKLKALDAESANTDAEKAEADRKRAIIAAAIARAKEKLAGN